MKKKSIIIAAICLFALIIPITIYAVGCKEHDIRDKRKTISLGKCQFQYEYYEYCANGCGYEKLTAHGNVFTQHTIGKKVRDYYKYTNITATQHTKTLWQEYRCENFSNCHKLLNYEVGTPATQKHKCANHVNKGQTTIHCCSCGKTKTGTSGNHW